MTIAEIAQRAGVSKTAVSRYLNHGQVSEEKKARIRAVIDETGYIPSRRAQDLRRGHSRTIGVLLPKIDSEPIGCVVAGISDVLEKKGFQLLLANTGGRMEHELSYLDYFKNDQVDGILFIADRLTPRHRKAIAGGTVPVVLIGQKTEDVSCVYHDDYASVQKLTQLLLRDGRQRIAMLARHPGTLWAKRIQGFRDAVQAQGLSPWIVYTGLGIEEGYAACQSLFEQHPDVQAILCVTDPIAVGALKYLREQGKRVPEDVAVAGMGHNRLSEVVVPRLTTVHYCYKTSGAQAARMLLEILEREADSCRQVELPYRIVEQESTVHRRLEK
ncbi:MAG: LacI family DNA-binding transcriptional regulator [Butyricicoccus sp.]|nr:LacI family DNA-binding transcriptional regulator [Butyricicoccus sp.]